MLRRYFKIIIKKRFPDPTNLVTAGKWKKRLSVSGAGRRRRRRAEGEERAGDEGRRSGGGGVDGWMETERERERGRASGASRLKVGRSGGRRERERERVEKTGPKRREWEKGRGGGERAECTMGINKCVMMSSATENNYVVLLKHVFWHGHLTVVAHIHTTQSVLASAMVYAVYLDHTYVCKGLSTPLPLPLPSATARGRRCCCSGVVRERGKGRGRGRESSFATRWKGKENVDAWLDGRRRRREEEEGERRNSSFGNSNVVAKQGEEKRSDT